MSFEDRIFEIESVLEGKPEAKDFDYIIKLFNTIEQENEELHSAVRVLKSAIRLVDERVVRVGDPEEFDNPEEDA